MSRLKTRANKPAAGTTFHVSGYHNILRKATREFLHKQADFTESGKTPFVMVLPPEPEICVIQVHEETQSASEAVIVTREFETGDRLIAIIRELLPRGTK